ncbi:hypothetical protein EMIHUDRAFT_224002 [Emiliania huxleyi CCMP1516]|uniref:Cystathionine gamma-synthase n=2 Tax=Emiliania huxleyi TaxID=2903 RepID=A0A0D3KT03_EMIH1|nr:hypothetical protein EMIHUDRAFT_224002 [Emiliania huxleyi CCMP1516]EOD38888.1 hypothetical protein EMIHUDRAFT_224002 [Emiliania huxleyi CCMP1516]|eukprot:XP_005791317.1 hypothetical protein EMIHUDRAFT_224002 [Emiliania huxleyi CCMP1516]
MRVAKLLEASPLVEQVFYPGLPSHPDHELAKRVFSSGAEFAAAPPNGAELG